MNRLSIRGARRLLAPVLLAGAACMPATATTPPAPARAPASTGVPGQQTPTFPNDIQWARNSAEHRAIYLEVYRAAGDRLQALAAGRAPGTWAVIVDADETVLDNSEFERSRIQFGGRFDPVAWTAWVKQMRAPALPGAVPFGERVHQLGGKVVVVTGRTDEECPPARGNLARVGFPADLVLCSNGSDRKDPRFRSVQDGTAAPGLPALTVLEWIGDNIQDFPGLTQAIRTQDDSAFARFGESFFALPNPMYGSWASNPSE